MDEIKPDAHALSLAQERARETRKVLMEIALALGVEVATIGRTCRLSFARRDEELDGGDGIRWVIHAQFSAPMDSVTLQGHPHLPSQVEGVDMQELSIELAKLMGTQDGTFQFVIPRAWLEAAYERTDALPADAVGAERTYDPALGAKLAAFADVLEESPAGEIELAPGVELKATLLEASARLRDGA